MAIKRVTLGLELLPGEGPGGDHYLGELSQVLPQLPERASLCYLDPPFSTGKEFGAYSDRWEGMQAYLAFLHESLELAARALREDGNLFLHVDHRAGAYARLHLDQILGEACFRNEIIWAYNSGGRSKRHFSRKHDTILYYALSKDSHFDPMAVALPRTEHRHNHMRRQVDEQGRAYRSIRSGGREYRYYDDDPVPPSDVWTDIAHLQQKDPERCGYPTQKPLKLLRRIVRCASKPDELVLDGFAGSGTSYLAASLEGRRFVGCDNGYEALCAVRGRLLGRSARLHVEHAPALPEDFLPAMAVGAEGFCVENARFFSLGRWSDGAYVHLRWPDRGKRAIPERLDEGFDQETNAVFCQTPEGQGVYLL